MSPGGVETVVDTRAVYDILEYINGDKSVTVRDRQSFLKRENNGNWGCVSALISCIDNDLPRFQRVRNPATAVKLNSVFLWILPALLYVYPEIKATEVTFSDLKALPL